MRAVDTNILVRLLVREDPDQAEIAESFIAPGAWYQTSYGGDCVGARRAMSAGCGVVVIGIWVTAA